MMNIQSCATAPGLVPMPTSAGPIERAGLTEVPVMLMPTIWMAASVRPIARPAKPRRHEGMRDAEDRREEKECRDDFEHEGRKRVVLAEIPRAPAVLAEPAGPALRLAGEDDIEHERADDRARDLRDPIGDHVRNAHTARDHHAEAHRRIDVAAGDRSDRVGHGDDREAEGARDAQEIDRGWAASHAPDHRRAATEKHQRERPDKFSQSLVHFAFLEFARELLGRPPRRAV